MRAQYRFRVRFRLDPEGVAVDPERFETTLTWPAPPPGEPGWRFFRDNLWRGEVADPAHLRELAGDRLGVPVESIEFRAFEPDREYQAALRAAVGEHLADFRADDPVEALGKYLGSSVDVQDGEG